MSNVLSQALYEATLDHLSVGIAASLADGKLLHLNRAAREMADEGWPIRVSRGFIQGEDRRRTEVLLRGLEEVANLAGSAETGDISLDICLAGEGSSGDVAVATLKPLALGDAEYVEPVIGLFITRLGRASIASLAGIADCFELTPAETRTLERFAAGGSVAEVAKALDLSENTVKTHLQKLFTKMRSSRQAHLVRIVSELTPPLRQSGTARQSQPARRQHRIRGVPQFAGLRL